MTTPLACLLFFSLWTLGLVGLGIAPVRVLAVLTGKAKATDFRGDVPQGSARFQRLHRAHLNSVENLTVFGAMVLIAHAVGPSNRTMDALAVIVVCARVGQSIAHVVSGSSPAVTVRFSFFAVQAIALCAMGVLIALNAR